MSFHLLTNTRAKPIHPAQKMAGTDSGAQLKTTQTEATNYLVCAPTLQVDAKSEHWESFPAA